MLPRQFIISRLAPFMTVCDAGRVRVRLDGGSLEIDVKPSNLKRISKEKGDVYDVTMGLASDVQSFYI